MGLRRSIIEMTFQTVIMSILITTGFLSPKNTFIDNVMTGIVVIIVVKILGYFFAKG